MAIYKHILFATDLSPESDQVADKAKKIAAADGAKLSIVHVVEYTPMIYGGGEFAIPVDVNIEETLEGQAKKALAKQAERVGIQADNQITRIGSTKQEITGLAEELGVDLIVVGSHSRHGLALLLGSTANATLHSAPCDVLAVLMDSAE